MKFNKKIILILTVPFVTSCVKLTGDKTYDYFVRMIAKKCTNTGVRNSVTGNNSDEYVVNHKALPMKCTYIYRQDASYAVLNNTQLCETIVTINKYKSFIYCQYLYPDSKQAALYKINKKSVEIEQYSEVSGVEKYRTVNRQEFNDKNSAYNNIISDCGLSGWLKAELYLGIYNKKRNLIEYDEFKDCWAFDAKVSSSTLKLKSETKCYSVDELISISPREGNEIIEGTFYKNLIFKNYLCNSFEMYYIFGGQKKFYSDFCKSKYNDDGIQNFKEVKI